MSRLDTFNFFFPSKNFMSSVTSLGLVYVIKQLSGSLLNYTRKIPKSQYKEKDKNTVLRFPKNKISGKSV